MLYLGGKKESPRFFIGGKEKIKINGKKGGFCKIKILGFHKPGQFQA